MIITLFHILTCLVAVLACSDLVERELSRDTTFNTRANQQGLTLPMYNELFFQRYVVNLNVGTPPQPGRVLLDTGSSDFWMPMSNSTGCQDTCPPRSYNPSKSSTSNDTGVPMNLTYGLTPDLQVTGEYFTDVLKIGATTIPNMTVGFGNVPPPLFAAGYWGILGIGPRRGEGVINNPSSPFYGNPNGTFPTLLDHFRSQGLIKRRAFSIYLDDQYAAAGSVIFGGIDRAKYYGDLSVVKFVLNRGVFTGYAVPLTSVTRTTATGLDIWTEATFGVAAVLDSGSPYMYLPTALAKSIHYGLNVTMHNEAPFVPCSTRNVQATIDFGFAGPNGTKISVPYSALVLPYGYPQGFGKINATSGEKLCYFGILGVPGSIFLLGDTFIRSAYLVYDVDNAVLAMAPARHGVHSSDVVEIPAGTGFPGVTSTATYVLPTASVVNR